MSWIIVFAAVVIPILPLSLLVVGEYLQWPGEPVRIPHGDRCIRMGMAARDD